jgi:ectoine hydroxylase-related dioxygenase (phytanoyl-CoA dioxygenase family)
MILTSNLEKYNEDGAFIGCMKNNKVLEEVKTVINERFSKDSSYYSNLSREDFSNYALSVQEEVNALDVQRRFVSSEKDLLSDLLKTEKICFQSICFLRAVRPEQMVKAVEAPDFHRETFYSDDPDTTKHMLNIWIPIKNVCENNTLKYVPKSHKIPDEELTVSSKNDLLSVEKFSSAHKLGFFWAQKKLEDGALVNDAIPASFSGNLGEYLAFSSMTIHGGARNLNDRVRFVVGFGLIAEEKINSNKDYFASGDKYFLKY